jgi:hypothetical protein
MLPDLEFVPPGSLASQVIATNSSSSEIRKAHRYMESMAHQTSVLLIASEEGRHELQGRRALQVPAGQRATWLRWKCLPSSIGS